MEGKHILKLNAAFLNFPSEIIIECYLSTEAVLPVPPLEHKWPDL